MSFKQDLTFDVNGNPLIVLGNDITLQFNIVTGDDIVVSADMISGATSISVQPLKSSLASSDRIRFGNLTVTLSALAKVGDTSLTISAAGGSVREGVKGQKVSNITGWTISFMVKVNPNNADASAVISKTATISDGSNGVASVAILRADTISGSTVLVPAANYYYALTRTDSGSNTLLVYGTLTMSQAAIR